MAVGAAMGRKTDLRLIHRLPLCVPETERMEALSLPEGGNTIMNDLDEVNYRDGERRGLDVGVTPATLP